MNTLSVMLSEMCHGQLHGLGIAPVTVATWHWPRKNLWPTEVSPFSPQPYPLATQTPISMSFGHCSATKKTHGIIRYHFLLQEQSHNEDPSLDILNAQRRKLLTLKTSIPLLIHQHCKEAEPPLAPRVYHVQVPYTRSLQLDWTSLGMLDLLAMCPKKAS